MTTPNQLLAEEVLEASRPKLMRYRDVEGKEIVITIRPLSVDDLIASIDHIVGIANQALQIGLDFQVHMKQMSDAARKAGEGEASAISAASPSPAEFVAALQKFILQSKDLVQWIVTTATDAPWETVSQDSLSLLILATEVLEHNTGPRLMDFFARVTRLSGYFATSASTSIVTPSSPSLSDSASTGLKSILGRSDNTSAG